MATDAGSLLIAAYLAHRDAVERLLTARLGSRDEAQDVAQELFLRLSRAAPAAEVEEPVGYVFRAALNLASDRRRQRKRALLRDADWIDIRHERSGDDTVADDPSAERSYAAKERLAAVKTALAELSPQCRQAFVLHKFEGLSHSEVAARAGISRSTVEKHMTTALKHLMRRLGRD